MNQVFLLGNRFDLAWFDDTTNAYARQVLALRRATSFLLYRARFQDDRGLAVSSAGVTAKLFTEDDEFARGAVINVLNPKHLADVRLHVNSSAFGPVKAAFAVPIGGELQRLPFTTDAGSVNVHVPSAGLSTILLLNRCRPSITVNVPDALQGEPLALTVHVFNPFGIPGTVTLSADVSEGWQTTPLEMKAEDGTQGHLLFTVPADAPESPVAIRLDGDVCGRSYHSTHTVDILPPLSATVELRGSVVAVTLRNNGRQPRTVTTHMNAPTSFLWKTSMVRQTVNGGASGVALFDLVKGPTLSAPQTISADITWAGGQLSQPLTIAPPAFDAERWEPHRYAGTGGCTRDAAMRHGNESSWLVTTDTPQSRFAWGQALNGLLPGVRYTFSVWCKTEAVSDIGKGAVVRVLCFDACDHNKKTCPWVFTRALHGTNDWTRLAATFMVPPGTGRVQFECFIDQASGKAWWSGAELTAE